MAKAHRLAGVFNRIGVNNETQVQMATLNSIWKKKKKEKRSEMVRVNNLQHRSKVSGNVEQ